jgi:hypothetical protein
MRPRDILLSKVARVSSRTLVLSLRIKWRTRQPPYEAAFRGVSWSYQNIDSTSTNKDTNKVAKGKKIGPPLYAQSPAALWSSIASDRTTKVARSLSVGKVFF